MINPPYTASELRQVLFQQDFISLKAVPDILSITVLDLRLIGLLKRRQSSKSWFTPLPRKRDVTTSVLQDLLHSLFKNSLAHPMNLRIRKLACPFKIEAIRTVEIAVCTHKLNQCRVEGLPAEKQFTCHGIRRHFSDEPVQPRSP